ncbi:putative GTPase activating protein for Arf-domain-containing protein [Russula compacta]|nr:putative GTPase activating protein for Arf-domain-containing protein [Russula compacta]
MNCASIHRKIGTHISKVRSLTMDVWSKEQVEHMRRMGNIKSNEMYNPNEVRHPPPTNMIDVERDSDLEKFIRDKYEFKRFVDRAAIVASHLGPSRSAASVRSSASSPSFPPSPTRSRTLPPAKPLLPSATSTPAAPNRTTTMPPSVPASTTMSRSVSQPIPPPAQSPQPLEGGVWSDLVSLQGSTPTSTLPLQYLSSIPNPSAPVQMTHLYANPIAGGPSLGTNFDTTSYNLVLTPRGPGLGSSVSPGANILGQGVAAAPVQPSFVLDTSGVNPFTQMTAQRQAQTQAQQNHFLSTSPFGSSLPQQPSFATQVQQPFSQSVTNPFFNAVAQPQSTLSPQPQGPFMPTTPSPVPFAGSPFQQPAQSPFQQQPLFQQPAQAPFQPQPPQLGNVQPGGGNPFTSWLTQQPNSYASAHVGQGSVNGQWGSV